MNWDVMYASKVEAIRGPSGQLLRYNPSMDQVTVLARRLWFANGVAVDKEEDYLLYAKTFSLRVAKHYLTGDTQGTIEHIVDGDPLPACKSTVAIRYG
jgi:sugar lactone lactonase YvrE